MQYALEWSESANIFHVQPLSDALTDAQMHFIKGTPVNYAIIFVGSMEACTEMAQHHHQTLRDRDQIAHAA